MSVSIEWSSFCLEYQGAMDAMKRAWDAAEDPATWMQSRDYIRGQLKFAFQRFPRMIQLLMDGADENEGALKDGESIQGAGPDADPIEWEHVYP